MNRTVLIVGVAITLALIAVLFLGRPESAEARAVQALAAVEGRYTLHNGETVVIAAQARLLETEFAMC